MVILDSSIWIAYWNIEDSHHQSAIEMLKELNEEVLMPEYILLEVLNVLLINTSKESTDLWLNTILNSAWIKIFASSEGALRQNLSFFLQNKHRKLSFVDQSLIILSQRYRVLSFDKELKKHLHL